MRLMRSTSLTMSNDKKHGVKEKNREEDKKVARNKRLQRRM